MGGVDFSRAERRRRGRAAVLPPSLMLEREQTGPLGRGWRGAAAAAMWFSPPWSLRVGTGIVVAE